MVLVSVGVCKLLGMTATAPHMTGWLGKSGVVLLFYVVDLGIMVKWSCDATCTWYCLGALLHQVASTFAKQFKSSVTHVLHTAGANPVQHVCTQMMHMQLSRCQNPSHQSSSPKEDHAKSV
jgi:hypothetical protein